MMSVVIMLVVMILVLMLLNDVLILLNHIRFAGGTGGDIDIVFNFLFVADNILFSLPFLDLLLRFVGCNGDDNDDEISVKKLCIDD